MLEFARWAPRYSLGFSERVMGMMFATYKKVIQSANRGFEMRFRYGWFDK
jgi:hypothetical protein